MSTSILSHLRLGLRELYLVHERELSITTPGLHHLLSIPLPERLILLAVIDGARKEQFRDALKVGKDDATLQSRRMQRTLKKVTDHLSNRHWFWPEVWTREDLTSQVDLTTGVIYPESNGMA